jgi:hypothetical protein
VPPFPVDALPPWVAEMVLAVVEFTQTPLDLAGCLAPAGLSTAAGRRADIEVRPGWRELLNLYTVVAMPPGSRKSAVFAAMTAPLLAAEKVLVEQVDAAARLRHYFLGHAMAVFDRMAADPTADDARAVLDWVTRSNRSGFTRREAFSSLSRARFRKIADLDPALAMLADHGYIRTRPPAAPTGGRPSSPGWEVHPRAAEAAQPQS